MTKPRNFPGRKHERRLDAIERLQENLAKTEKEFPSKKNEIAQMRRELNTLISRTKSGGKKLTKKVGTNIGRL